jgi:NADH-quinone oxidoreductase subunit L
LKLGHSAFFGAKGENVTDKVKDPSWAMTIPMLIIAGFCILFGVWNPLPLQNLIQPILGERLEGHDFSGFHPNWLLIGISMAVLLLAVLNHLFGVRKTKKGLGAVDHIHYAPVLSTIYSWAEKGYFDPYNISMLVINGVSKVMFWIDRGIDWIYNVAAVKTAEGLSFGIRKAHNGNHSMYILWSLIGLAVLLLIFVRW